MIEREFDIAFVAQMAQREKQIQQSYRPIIGVHKWFARRPGTLFRALLLAEFAGKEPLASGFFNSHDLGSLLIADPFMGGGTPLLEAVRVGCRVVGADINPMAYWVVRQELTELDRSLFRQTAEQVMSGVAAELGDLYQTSCVYCGNVAAPVKYFLWVKQQICTRCEQPIDLFPSYVIAKNQRHPNYVLACPACGSLNEVSRLAPEPGVMRCTHCHVHLMVDGPAQHNKCTCLHCGHVNLYPNGRLGPPRHRLFALEYHCPQCRPSRTGRLFKAPDGEDLRRVAEAERRLEEAKQDLIPEDEVPPGDETDRLHRWGYRTYRELFNARQLLGLNTLATAIAAVTDEPVRHALLTVFSDTLRYQNMICRYDSYALKILDVFAIHGFPVSLVQCENTLIGIPDVGSGGFRHFVAKYDRAKAYCEKPFEIAPGRPKRTVYQTGEKIQARLVASLPAAQPRLAYLTAAPADTLRLSPGVLDAVLTDPPYYGNVQYAELMDFCYVWLRKHLSASVPAFQSRSTRTAAELTVNQTEGRDITHFSEGLSRVFVAYAQALKPGKPFAFTYHHNDVDAYLPVAVALLDARLACTASLPCPTEMSASIHISDTQSSVLDTIFVCRTTGTVRASQFESTPEALERLLVADLEKLRNAGLELTLGDARCLLLGHLVRLAVWRLRARWDLRVPLVDRLAHVKTTMNDIYALPLLGQLANRALASLTSVDLLAGMRVKEEKTIYDDEEQTPF